MCQEFLALTVKIKYINNKGEIKFRFKTQKMMMMPRKIKRELLGKQSKPTIRDYKYPYIVESSNIHCIF